MANVGSAHAAGPVVITGGSGRLGRELQVELPAFGVGELLAPTRAQLDITDRAGVTAYVGAVRPPLIVHAAAFTDVAGAEQKRQACWTANVQGTRNLVAAAREVQARFVLISTDYVFYGDQEVGEGREPGYREDDTPGPVRNYYALTKLVAEEAARAYAGALVLRTSFRPREWPYRNAFDDLFTSQDYVDVIAPMVAEAVFRHGRGEVPYGTLHVATERKSVYELARRRAPDVTRASRTSASVELPADVSLNTERWQALQRRWAEAPGG